MSFDPNLPADGTDMVSSEMRTQLTGLKALIDAMPVITNAVVDSTNTLNPGDPATANASMAGTTIGFTFGIPQGAIGPQGLPFAQAVVDSVTTLNPGDPASVVVGFDGINVHFNFSIPRGIDGLTGPTFGNTVVDGVTTLNPWESAQVQTSFDGSNVRFTFGIPRGQDGPMGPQGEVSGFALSNAIAGTSANTNMIGTLDVPFANPDLELLRQKLNELILNGRR
jgi:hypothetical protein